MAKKKLLFVQTSLDPSEGGVPRVSNILSGYFNRLGIHCYFMYYESDSPVYPPEDKYRIDIQAPGPDFNKSFSAFVLAREIELIICQNADHPKFLQAYKEVWDHYGIGTVSFYHACPDFFINQYRINPPFSFDNLGLIIKNALKKLIFPFYNPYAETVKRQYDVSRQMVLLSSSYIQKFQSLYQLKEEGKLIALANPLTFDGVTGSGIMDRKEKIVLVVCRLAEVQKRVSVILRIWKNLTQHGETDWKLWIVGSGPDEAMYKRYAVRHGLTNVSFLGKKTDVLPYYEKASIFLMTSVWEGFPMVLLEAMQNGVVPIVFNNFSAVYDQVEDGESGFIVPDNDHRIFLEKLRFLMREDRIRKRMSLVAMESVKKFSMENLGIEWTAKILDAS